MANELRLSSTSQREQRLCRRNPEKPEPLDGQGQLARKAEQLSPSPGKRQAARIQRQRVEAEVRRDETDTADAQLDAQLRAERGLEVQRWMRSIFPRQRLEVRCVGLTGGQHDGFQECLELRLPALDSVERFEFLGQCANREDLALRVRSWLDALSQLAPDDERKIFARLRLSPRTEEVQAWMDAAGFPASVLLEMQESSSDRMEAWKVSAADRPKRALIVSSAGEQPPSRAALLERILCAAEDLRLVDAQSAGAIRQRIVATKP